MWDTHLIVIFLREKTSEKEIRTEKMEEMRRRAFNKSKKGEGKGAKKGCDS